MVMWNGSEYEISSPLFMKGMRSCQTLNRSAVRFQDWVSYITKETTEGEGNTSSAACMRAPNNPITALLNGVNMHTHSSSVWVSELTHPLFSLDLKSLNTHTKVTVLWTPGVLFYFKFRDYILSLNMKYIKWKISLILFPLSYTWTDMFNLFPLHKETQSYFMHTVFSFLGLFR